MLVEDIVRLGQLIHNIDIKMIAKQNKNLTSMGVTVQQGLILIYLYVNKDKKITQKMLEVNLNITNPTVQKGATVVVNQNWYNLYNACSKVIIAGDEYGAQSTMLYGNQWDEVLDWLVDTGMDRNSVYVDSSTWGNYNNYNTANGYEEGNQGYEENAGRLQPAGSSEYWKANNIYDFSGNAFDWIQEADDINLRVYRGGYFSDSGSNRPASCYYRNNPCNTYAHISSRVALYIDI